MDHSVSPVNLNSLTTEEKVKLTSGKDFWSSEAFPEHGIPSIRMSDGPHGLRYQAAEADHLGINDSVPSTSFPTASASASSWDPELIAAMGEAIGLEARSLGVDVVLGPGVNMKRNPLCGRNFEYFSEDPFLAGKLGSAWIQGIQKQGVAACLKHFAANNQENGRLSSNSIIDPVALHEIYLEAFRIAVTEGHPESVMCSYNKVNGRYASDNHYLMTQVLRNQFGFDGAVITDWGALNDKVASLNAGTDLEMPGDQHLFDKEALKAFQTGELRPASLDRAAANIAKMARKQRPKFTGSREDLLHQHAQLAQKIAESAIVLLKNDDGILPLAANEQVAVVGELAKETRFQGAGSSHIKAAEQVPILTGLKQAGIAYDYAAGYRLDDQVDEEAIAQALELARTHDKVIFVAGLPDNYESEGFDRQNMALPKVQNDLLQAIAAINPHVVVLLVAGAPVELPWLDQVQAVLDLYLGGEQIGAAAGRVLTGQVNPSGKLAETYPVRYADIPSAELYDHRTRSVPYVESTYIGYRYFDKAQVPVAFPFGFGLSYTSFVIKNARLTDDHVTDDQPVTVQVELTNTGSRDGAEVVQAYVQEQAARPLRPIRELKAFKKVLVKAGETMTVTLAIPAQAFKEWHEQTQTWELPDAAKAVAIGTSSADIVSVLPVQVHGQAFTNFENVPDWYTTPSGKPTVHDFEQLTGQKVPPHHEFVPGEFTRLNTPREMQKYSWLLRLVARTVIKMRTKDYIDKDGPEAKFQQAIVLDTPLIRLAQQASGALRLSMVDRLVAAANHQYLKMIFR
ncbi:glycoside hydrolase family 3 C-terminal domain-containing protein [Lacticaseibacillus casei]|uniref:Glycoside hydrolase family 3 C-terminal domain-containing protein n=1 Tax=Lacticaseibacillus huelsenbergensis TaxID=3035291 RepID=A0ABY8DMT8_9LACO|nr:MULTISPECIES: glycoside hydrolase family 3 C-terminal domain-containing protein [Lacticaseibacillus]MDG3062608.1 glycoside hydrolase family 3 C-terminal domain-containing protein [Lacticaseibacillus sp. BCRC 81376]QVI38420.1 glycoside hydrolase family 3 C-terminal domain-containing protein [Lacticaseibacillus casei]QXG60232.1 glycoside hydrolase family 3 C-terminal domain-containing protein [Lacticaseibacillus casei]WFB38291.1 glycoside hydrolase family 3 C-terminal domain-containing protein